MEVDQEEGEDEAQKEEESAKDQPGMEPKVTYSSFHLVIADM